MAKVNKLKRLNRRKLSVRKNIFGTGSKPRVSVHRTNLHIYVQAIDDSSSKTLASANDKGKKAKSKVEIGGLVGEELGEKLAQLKVKEIVFDRSGYRYHGRVKALADGIRSKGIKF